MLDICMICFMDATRLKKFPIGIMKSLKESLFDNDLVSKDPVVYHPKTRDELEKCIEKELKKQGPDANLNIIDTSKITNMYELFYSFRNDIRNIDISLWDMRNVENMECMFDGCKSFNSDLSKWDVSKVENMYYMFYGCEKFNCDLSKWDVKNVEDMYGMFYGCKSFNSDLSSWNIRRVKDMRCMFVECENFNSDLSKWDVGNVRYMRDMFFGCKSLKKIPNWYEKS